MIAVIKSGSPRKCVPLAHTILVMRILYISQYFPPEIGAPAARVSELSKRWTATGHDVTVLTGFPNHPTGEIHPHYRSRFRKLTTKETLDGVDVRRTWLWPLPNRKPLERIINYTSFAISAVLRGLFIKKPDVIIATSPQLLVGISGWLLGRVKRVPVTLEVRDIWPDAILASGVSRPGSRLAKTLSAISRFLYRRCDHIVVVTPAFIEELVSRWRVPSEKISMIVNGVETNLFAPGDSASAKQKLGLDKRFVVSYVGTVGLAHGIRTVLDAAPRISSSHPDVLFLIVGEGAEREQLEEEARRRRLSNVVFEGQKARTEIPAILQASDACLVLLKRTDAFKQVIPTKMLEFMSSGTPVILGVEGQAREIVESANGGICIEPENVDELIAAIERLKSSRKLRLQLGESGRRCMIEAFSRERTAQAYVEVLEQVIRN